MADMLAARKAIESLRLGVPTLASVTALPPKQPGIIRRFERLIALGDDRADPFLVEGNFGSGKSHVLTFLLYLAKTRRIATSLISVSKDLQLGDVDAVTSAAVSGIRFPDDRLAGTLSDVLAEISERNSSYSALLTTLAESSPTLCAATALYAHVRGQNDEEQYVRDLWDGSVGLQLSQFRRRCREYGVTLGDEYKRPTRESLAMERLAGIPRLLRAVGLDGWLIVLDEIELIGKLGKVARAKAYATLQRLFSTSIHPRLFVIGAITPDFQAAVIRGRGDDQLRKHWTSKQTDYIEMAERGVDFLVNPRSIERITAPDDHELELAYEAVSDLYRAAYQQDIEIDSPVVDRARSVRSMIREWITRLDLRYLYGTSGQEVHIHELRQDLSQSDDFEYSTETL